MDFDFHLFPLQHQVCHAEIISFRWRVSPTPTSTSTPGSSLSSSSATKTSSVKRERSVPPEKQQLEKEDEEEQATSDTELMGSPKKRKKTGLFDGHLLEKVCLRW